MKMFITTLLVLSSTSLTAATWEESFDAATSKAACEVIYDRMEARCDLAGISPGRQDQSKVRYCKGEAKSLFRRCERRIDTAAEDAATEAADKAAAAEKQAEARANQEARRRERDHLVAITKGRAPDLDLSCERLSARRIKSGDYMYDAAALFAQTFELQVFFGGACYGVPGAPVTCSITTSSISGDWGRTGGFTVSRVTGGLTASTDSAEATYSCQKASAAVKIF